MIVALIGLSITGCLMGWSIYRCRQNRIFAQSRSQKLKEPLRSDYTQLSTEDYGV